MKSCLDKIDLDAIHYKKNSKNQYLSALNLVDSLSLNATSSVLDIGCGHGEVLKNISKINHQGICIGIDPSISMINHAIELYPNLSFYNCTAEEMLFPDNFFDFVLCTNAFMWIRNPKKVIEKISKILKPGGEIAIFTYSKATPYVQLFEYVLKKMLPNIFQYSAVRTMLETAEYEKIVSNCKLNLHKLESQSVVFTYPDKKSFVDYAFGWLSCYAPIPENLQMVFIEKVFAAIPLFRDKSHDCKFAIQHESLTIRAKKPK